MEQLNLGDTGKMDLSFPKEIAKEQLTTCITKLLPYYEFYYLSQNLQKSDHQYDAFVLKFALRKDKKLTKKERDILDYLGASCEC